ncbi:unnamed protein product, partial [Heterosigma akashiwo]
KGFVVSNPQAGSVANSMDSGGNHEGLRRNDSVGSFGTIYGGMRRNDSQASFASHTNFDTLMEGLNLTDHYQHDLNTSFDPVYSSPKNRGSRR